ncbi:MAG: isopeptide-forming domain-containing fimbrial protein, partial [Gammaproteobacteria bacterium]|nr:isopeptide-forming domain-containing fimbrial protein [Gammaproteobacteria bacterium]
MHGLLVCAALVLPMEATGAWPGSCTPDAGVEFIRHDLSVSFCELCGQGQVRLVVSNPLGVDLTHLTVVENLRASGLTYVPGSTRFDGTYVADPDPFEPAVSGTNGSVLTWSFGSFVLPGPRNPSQSNRHSSLEILFDVERYSGLSEEGLVWADRDIRASVSYRSDCSGRVQTVNTALEELPIEQPIPRVTKRGRNIDAAQGGYSDPVYGNTDDDVIWRIQISNSGAAPMQDITVSDVMSPGNYLINYACPTDASAVAVANNNGVAPGGSPCVQVGPTTSINDFRLDPPFGDPPAGALLDAPEGGNAYVYLVGKITNSCVNRSNTAQGLEWGCEVDNPDGGISTPASNNGAIPSFRTSDSATLSTFVNSGLTVQRQITGTNTSQPAGSKGTVTLRITNNTGGTVKNIRLRDILPPQYVIDPTWWTDTTPPAAWSGVTSGYYATRALTVQPAYGNYPGMTNRITWTNPAPGSLDGGNTDPAVRLANTSPEFTLWSSTLNQVDPANPADDQHNLLRRGDRITVSFPIVLVDPAYHDKVANLDVREEAPNSDPPNTDPAATLSLQNRVDIWYEQFCNGTVLHQNWNDSYTARPEDLDVDISGSELVFILTNNPAQPLPLTVQLTNHGGHDAADYATFVSFGVTMSVVSAPAGCSVTSNPPPLAVWREPAPIPANATVYRCTGSPVAPGQTRSLPFQVVKSTDPVALAADDLTFRADVVGEITLSDGTPLWFPTPSPRADGVTDRANNYSLDGIRARVIGFNLLKTQLGLCSEENLPPPALPDRFVQIGEECSFHIDTGGWFGFQTPGFTYIAVQRIQVVDELPAGGQASSQRYLASSNPYAQSTSAIRNVSLNPSGLNPLDATSVDWTFNQAVPAERITQKDEWFKVDITTRLLNNAIDTRAAPNVHAAQSRNILNSSFEAVFADTEGEEEIYLLGPSTVGYPQQSLRRVDLTITEPQILIEHEVCNLTRSGGTCSDADFHALATGGGLGDAYDEYLYRIVLTNQAASGGVARAPAYDLAATVMLDPTGLEYVIPFTADGFDNDGDGVSDGADALEGTITNNVFGVRGVQASITYHHDHSAPLKRIAAGESVTLYYRVKPYPEVAPGQWLEHTVSVSYDSLPDEYGNQSTPTRPTGDIGGARAYTDSAWVRSSMVPVQVEPKQIVRVANTPAHTPLPDRPHPVAVGEEVEYELVTYLPVAKLRSFTLTDNLPQGIRCVEAPVVDLGPSGPHAQAQFSPGGTFTPTCTDGLVQWQFGDQEITNKDSGDEYYRFAVRFIARVENTVYTNDGVVIGNGGSATAVQADYVDEAGATVTLQFGRVDLVVKEPRIALTKAFDVAAADAADELTVTVTATNTGSAAAYNLRVLDDLAAVRNLTFLGSVGGLDPPDVVDTTTFGPNRPLFRWNPANPDFVIAPGETRSFSFKVRVDTPAQPQEILGNTVQASWTSLPGGSTALNTGGSIGADGSVTGMRNGALPPAGDAVNDYEASAQASVTVPAVVFDKSDLDPSLVPAVGAHKHFQLEIRLPEGTTEDLVVRDNLAAGPLGFVLADNA